MGFYSYCITVPVGRLEANPVERTVDLSHGVITKVSFRPRPGHCAELHAVVYHRRHQIFPENADDSLHGDTFPIEWEDWYEMFEPPFTLTIKAWNDDPDYDHTFDISFAMLPKFATLPYAFARTISDVFSLLSPKRIFSRSK